MGMGVPTSVCRDEHPGATFFRVAKAEAPHDDPPAKGALGIAKDEFRIALYWEGCGVLSHRLFPGTNTTTVSDVAGASPKVRVWL